MHFNQIYFCRLSGKSFDYRLCIPGVLPPMVGPFGALQYEIVTCPDTGAIDIEAFVDLYKLKPSSNKAKVSASLVRVLRRHADELEPSFCHGIQMPPPKSDVLLNSIWKK